MIENLKPNNCIVNFECTNPKKCVHYKKPKREPKPCKRCAEKECKTDYMDGFCFCLENWRDYMARCYYNYSSGQCYNTTAQVQAITKYLKSIGVSVTYGGLKDEK